ncbi:beta-L-arabinofuranosidase domain-containing protein [Rubrolithibacter danxiaensis]|uniref:beta-L-arabinofuranosidase domain-containing protein n=1 Tax=Rubrolithibacter danxiaensis TaxID=3390805 RepID=UPI003BF8B255
MKSLALFFIPALILSFKADPAGKKNVSPEDPPGSFVHPVYAELPLGAVKPKGWLRHQLQIMRDGSTGHLDETYWKLKNDNGWLGGKGDGWEETPYWLDGAVPLAYLLDDKALQQKVLKYINWTIQHQRPSGYFGPVTKAEREKGIEIKPENCKDGDDWWPKMVMLKVIKQYYTATKDSRVIPFMTKYFDYQLKTLKSCPLSTWTEWAESRGADNVLIVQWLYGITKNENLLELAAILQAQSFQWSNWLGNRNWVIDAAAQQNDEFWMRRHGVNVGMALKDPALNYQRTGDPNYIKALNTGFNDIMNLHGLPMGVFSADEDLHGNNPTQGTELCAIVESMFSLEEIIAITGDVHYMDALERMTFNALPTQTTDDYNNKQYFQIANQVQVKRGVFNFSLPFDREMNNVFGARSGYTCCLANMHQGWTKFTSHLWYATADKGLAALEYSPNQITARVGDNDTEVIIDEQTEYPFDDRINFEINTKKAVTFPMQLRIPSWCKEAIILINGQQLQTEKGGKMVTVNRTWKNKDKLTLQLPMNVNTSNWGRNSRTVERGPLVYALKLNEKWEKGHDEKEGDYFNVYPKEDWNYGLLDSIIKNPAAMQVKKVKPATESFIWNLENAPLEITASAKKIPGWKIVNDVAPQPVTDRTGLFKGEVSNTPEEIKLVPYGCTKVRIVAFPVVK